MQRFITIPYIFLFIIFTLILVIAPSLAQEPIPLPSSSDSTIFALLAPSDAASLASTSVTFSWSELPGAKWYQLHIIGRKKVIILKQKFEDTAAICASGVCSIAIGAPDVPLEPEQRYKWWVVAKKDGEKVKTDKWKFTTGSEPSSALSTSVSSIPVETQNVPKELKYLAFVEYFSSYPLKWWESGAVETLSGFPAVKVGYSQVFWGNKAAIARLEANQTGSMELKVDLELGTDPTRTYTIRYITWGYGFRYEKYNVTNQDDVHRVSVQVKGADGSVLYESPECTYVVGMGNLCSNQLANLNIAGARRVTVTYSTVGSVSAVGNGSYVELVMDDFQIQTTTILDNENLPTKTPSPTPCVVENGFEGSTFGRNGEVCQVFITNTPRPTNPIGTPSPTLTPTLSDEQYATIFPLPMIEPTTSSGTIVPVRLSDLDFVDRAYEPTPGVTPLCSRDMNPYGMAGSYPLIAPEKALVMIADPKRMDGDNKMLGNFVAIRISVGDLPVEIRDRLSEQAVNPTVKTLIEAGFGYLFIGYGHLGTLSLAGTNYNNPSYPINKLDLVGASGKSGLENDSQAKEHLDISVYYVSGPVQNSELDGTTLPPGVPTVDADYHPEPIRLGAIDENQEVYSFQNYFTIYLRQETFFGIDELIDPLDLWPLLDNFSLDPNTNLDYECP